ncbi:DUF642 domain-containing protein [Frankia sp. CNm7]|uniref:DUF642 domain-containing protein n=1 Tax=Frankia nepalensis TaxID=1836974 RepID=A0A937UPF1_9ACTN|nr:DUF642 domain-containing protein [Frankia nepalensis]MBL7498113.1 DUF642 domain-containing protein [Frankia nepalensis]MBL7509272.1 DUF642 domain-containing protein [Frankia nepalensis]MBL7522743.1 DUF642 domain-containing protein [Frankia nepalensis]MBL7630809.1 DUF642 domain-containing protein [Frankia nepalensis]
MRRPLAAAVTAAVAALMVLGVDALPAQAVVTGVTTSGFEEPAIGTPVQEFGGGQYLEGWEVYPGTVDVVGQDYWQAADGAQSVDLNGSGPGGISQKFEVVPNEWYELRFSLAGNPEGGLAEKRLGVFVDGGYELYSFDTTGHSGSEMGYRTESLRWLADDADSEVIFRSFSQGPWGPVIDNVRFCVTSCEDQEVA